MKRPVLAAALLGAVLSSTLAQSSPPQPRPLPAPEQPATVTGTLLEPTPKGFSPDVLARLKVPAGFTVSAMATELGNARMMQVMPDGGLYLTRRAQGDVLYLNDANKDGKIEPAERKTVAQNIKLVHGITERGGKLYLAADRRIWVADIGAAGKLSAPRVFVDGLPDVGQHSARNLAFGPDRYLYLSVGSTCNNCRDENPESATILRIAPDGKSREVYARGLRHTIGFGWHPVNRVLYGLDQGSDWRGDDQPPEELNRIERGANYGWPFCYADRQPDRYASADVPGNVPKAEYCQSTQAPLLTYTAHAAAIAMRFYTAAQFPAEYRNDAFAAMRGSWNRSQPSGYEVVRVHFDAQGQPQRIEPFLTGFVYKDDGPTGGGWAQFARVAGVAQYTDGSLLVTDDQNGVIYRVRYTGGAK